MKYFCMFSFFPCGINLFKVTSPPDNKYKYKDEDKTFVDNPVDKCVLAGSASGFMALGGEFGAVGY